MFSADFALRNDFVLLSSETALSAEQMGNCNCDIKAYGFENR
jgi:hypothetical protein